jgi:hypothetical protein
MRLLDKRWSVDFDFYQDKDWVHPKCDKAKWAKTHIHQSHSIFNKQSHFSKTKNILGLNHRAS